MILPQFSKEEAFLLSEVRAGHYFQPHEAESLWSDVASAVAIYGAANKRGLIGDALIEKLRSLDQGSSLNLWGALARAWNRKDMELTEALMIEGASIIV